MASPLPPAPLLIGCWGSVNFYSFGALEGQLWRLWALKTEVLGPTWEVLGPGLTPPLKKKPRVHSSVVRTARLPS